jgi:hypothetical protein
MSKINSNPPLSPKDPAEKIVLTFDFTDIPALAPLTNPFVTVDVSCGDPDPLASAMLLGSPVVRGLLVFQEVIGGVPNTGYDFHCEVDSADANHYKLSDTLPVIVQ